MTDTILRGALGRCDLVKKIPSRQITQIIIELPIEYHVAATQLLDGQDVWVELAPDEVKIAGRYCVIDGGPVMPQQAPKSAATPKPYGKEASELYKSGFYFVPEVLAAIGTDKEYREWIQSQPCIVCGGGDFVWGDDGEPKCEAAHVKRPSNSGLGHKPEYSCVSLCHEHHAIQHQYGLPRLYGVHVAKNVAKRGLDVTADDAREWFDRKRNGQLVEWASTTLASRLRQVSTGFIPPRDLVQWAMEKGVAEFLPEPYRSAA
jgi:hypothetical protein